MTARDRFIFDSYRTLETKLNEQLGNLPSFKGLGHCVGDENSPWGWCPVYDDPTTIKVMKFGVYAWYEDKDGTNYGASAEILDNFTLNEKVRIMKMFGEYHPKAES